jgi:hypothetical protein
VLDTTDATFGSISSAAIADRGMKAIPTPMVAIAAKKSRREQLEFNSQNVAYQNEF